MPAQLPVSRALLELFLQSRIPPALVAAAIMSYALQQLGVEFPPGMSCARRHVWACRAPKEGSVGTRIGGEIISRALNH